MPMKTINERMIDVSGHLQSLAAPKFSSEIKDAVEKNDKNSLIKVCRKANIPQKYVGTIVSVIFSVQPQKWPLEL
jgi:hypothetical protein